MYEIGVAYSTCAFLNDRIGTSKTLRIKNKKKNENENEKWKIKKDFKYDLDETSDVISTYDVASWLSREAVYKNQREINLYSTKKQYRKRCREIVYLKVRIMLIFINNART